ncbi:uncharacterized protein LOC129750616 [Uranotaenia lowii]|uniref:uncharacterized protein LOC129750616 n=1 Tax=Uranotaenia lowii TaxID=190385 RepID=UPI0024786C00|nr:uncharacterized protein LOC129750616 [Uranotaenia lowii]
MFNRIQKLLLLGEYRKTLTASECGGGRKAGGFCWEAGNSIGSDGVSDSPAGDTILIESPFAQVDLCGRGIRAVELGLSHDSLLVAYDNFLVNPVQPDGSVTSSDPEMDSLEMLCVLPLRFVKLKVVRHGADRTLLRVTLVTNRRLYFEFGGGRHRPLLVNVWRDRIQELKLERKYTNCGSSRKSDSPLSEKLQLQAKLPQHLRRFLNSSASSRVSTDTDSSIQEWERRHQVREKKRLVAQLAALLSHPPSHQGSGSSSSDSINLSLSNSSSRSRRKSRRKERRLDSREP